MAQDYREIYRHLLKHKRDEDDLLRDAGIDVLGQDSINVSHSALFVYFAQKVNDLEKQIEDLNQSQETKR